jgi:hypothetical protein
MDFMWNAAQGIQGISECGELSLYNEDNNRNLPTTCNYKFLEKIYNSGAEVNLKKEVKIYNICKTIVNLLCYSS